MADKTPTIDSDKNGEIGQPDELDSNLINTGTNEGNDVKRDKITNGRNRGSGPNESDTRKAATGQQQNRNGVDLISAIKNKDKSLASKLITEGVDVDFVDELDCNTIHYAAREGFDDLIAELVSLGANVKKWDCAGDTPLHKAARTGHDSTVATLVSFGANIDALNLNGVNPLECAIKRNHNRVIEVLCMFGVDLVMQEEAWNVVIAAKDSKRKNDQELIEILQRHKNRLAGFKHGGIKYDVKYIEKGKYTPLKETCVFIQGKEVPFIFYCCKLSAEYSSITKYVSGKQEPFGDVYECRKWGGPQKVFTLTIKIKGVLKSNETAEIASPDGKIGRIDDTTQSEEIKKEKVIQYTVFKITLTLRPNVMTTFVIVKTNKPETIAITTEAVKIQPKVEPEAEIDIPKGTFDEPGDLLLNVVETKDVEKTDDEIPETDAVILTNVLAISMSNHQQPKQPIDMSLPMHVNMRENNDVAILMSSKELPNKPEDWEVLECIPDSRRKLARFKIPHFSICTAVSKKKLKKDMLAVTALVQAALKHERQVEFFAMAQTVSETEYAVVIECTLLRNAKKRKRHWKNKGYDKQDPEGFTQTVKLNSWFRITFEGNLKQRNAGPHDTHKLLFEENRDNYRTFSVEMIDSKDLPIGRIKIESLEEIDQEPIEVVENACFGSKVSKKAQDPLQAYTDLTVLPLHVKPLPPPPPPVEHEERSVRNLSMELDDPQCTIKALSWPSLHKLTERLDMKDVRYLAAQLRYKPNELSAIEANHQLPSTFLMYILKDWRGMRPYNSQVDFLENALLTIDKTEEAEALRQAFNSDREILF